MTVSWEATPAARAPGGIPKPPFMPARRSARSSGSKGRPSPASPQSEGRVSHSGGRVSPSSGRVGSSISGEVSSVGGRVGHSQPLSQSGRVISGSEGRVESGSRVKSPGSRDSRRSPKSKLPWGMEGVKSGLTSGLTVGGRTSPPITATARISASARVTVTRVMHRMRTN